MKASGYWTCYGILRRLCFFPCSYLFTHLLVLHQVTELFMRLNIPNYQNWNSSVLGHFFEVSSLNEKYESIRLLNLLCYFAEVVLLSSQLFVHSFVSFASRYWTCYAFEFSKLSKLKFKCFGTFFKISRLNEKCESIGFLDLLCYQLFPKYYRRKLKETDQGIRLLNLLCFFCRFLSSQLFVHWFLSFASSYWTWYAFEFSKLSKLKFKCFGSFLRNF